MQGAVGVVLAAGRGRRLGGPKALLAWARFDDTQSSIASRPLAEAHAHAWRACRRVLIVTRGDIGEALRSLAPTMAADIVVSVADDELGPAGSLSAAAARLFDLGERDVRMLVTPVDCPPVLKPTCRALLTALEADGVVAAKPRHEGRGGHPVALAPAVWHRYRTASEPLRDVLRALPPASVRDVAVDDVSVLRDVDRPDDLGSRPVFLGWDPP